MNTNENRKLLLPSGGDGKLRSFQIAQLIHDITVHFVELYVPADSRTRDQIVQAARSGMQNIAEGSIDAATSVKLELNLYNVARASLEKLRLDYQGSPAPAYLSDMDKEFYPVSEFYGAPNFR